MIEIFAFFSCVVRQCKSSTVIKDETCDLNKFNKTVKNQEIKSDKWIVITTINPPSKGVKILMKLPDPWKIVVVGDKKTKYKPWKGYEGSEKLIFLSIEEQLKLNQETLKYLPYNSYSRKTLGYLYAIEHGAKEIYETDDDNELINTNYLNYTINSHQLISYVNVDKKKMINPYSYFGQATIWPRGFRLSDIGKNYINNYYNMTHRINIKSKVLIYQGVVNGDPDVDAIFRLTRINKYNKINVKFDDRKVPLLYLPGNFVPINTQNTRYDYKVFLALALPGSLSFRVCDIWRGFILQKLSWLYNGLTLFHGPSLFHERNIHNYMNDFKEELSLYNDLDKLLKILDTDISKKNLSISEYFIKIIENLVKHKILKKMTY